jgi:hypothetical protein
MYINWINIHLTLYMYLQVVCGHCLMPVFLGLVRHFCKAMSTYVPGTYSMAFVTVPNIEVAKKLSQ